MSAPAPKYFKAWIVFFLIATVGGAIVGGIFGGIAGGIMGVAGFDADAIRIVATVLGFVIGVPISYLAYRWTVSEFIVKPLTPPPQVAPAASVPPPLPPAAGQP